MVCIREGKRAFRKARRRREKRVITKVEMLDCELVGNLTQEIIERFAESFAEFLKGA